ncbi:MAG: ribosome silencing factor [Spirochaetales bacterium]|nr:ribosome silencing factor [Spirochaetales bacterium]
MNRDTVREDALKISRFLEDQKCQDVVVLDLLEHSSWTDFFIICTVGSKAHASGVLKYLNDFLYDIYNDVNIVVNKKSCEKSWIFIDCPGIGIHIMNNESRDFYNLENLWYMAEKLNYQS